MPHVVLPGHGARVWVESRGEGPALVLLNGMSQSTSNWLSQVRALQGRFRVVTYDARAQGRSDIGPLPFRLEDHVSDLAAVLDALDIREAALAGFSHGARVALAFAETHPERTSRLVLTSMGTNHSALRNLIVRSWGEILRLGGLEAMAWASLPDILGERFLRANQAHIDGMIRATLQRNTPEGLGALLEGMSTYPSPLEDAPRVGCPVLLLTSTEDLLVPVEAATELARAFRVSRHILVPGCGHTIPVEEPEAWRAQVVAFLSGV